LDSGTKPSAATIRNASRNTCFCKRRSRSGLWSITAPPFIDIPVNGILSRTLYQDEHVKVVIFGFAEGQELSAHTAPFRAILHVLDGEARIKLGADTVEAGPGAWIAWNPTWSTAFTPTSPCGCCSL
jgi:hypothetical protein